MRVLLLPAESFRYLMHVFASHTQAGIPPDEVLPAADLFARIQRAQTVDFSKLGKAEIEKLGPEGVTMNLTPDNPPAETPPAAEPDESDLPDR